MQEAKMQKVTVYTKMLCGYCYRAKSLLASKNVEIEEIDITMNGKARDEMLARAHGGYTVPQIFIGDTHVGGCNELYALENEGGLDPLLEG